MSIKLCTSATACTTNVKIGNTLHIIVLLIVVQNYIDFWLPQESKASIRGSIEKKFVTFDVFNRSDFNLSSAVDSSPFVAAVVATNDDDNAGNAYNKYNYAEEENNMTATSSSIRTKYEYNEEEDDTSNSSGVQGGHWEYDKNAPKPYVYSSKVCNATNILKETALRPQTTAHQH